jgi:hypothetical protein
MDQEMINKAFEKNSAGTSSARTDQSSTKLKGGQAVKPDNKDKSGSADDVVKTGVSGSA